MSCKTLKLLIIKYGKSAKIIEVIEKERGCIGD
jgi:hypothetical protein